MENLTDTRFVRSCELFSGFVYLRHAFPAMGLNAATRLLDKAAGTRLSRYGWAFVFARQPMTVERMPSYFNVCRKCGSGNSAEFLRSGIKKTVLGIGFYNCPNCGERNLFIPPPPDFIGQ